MKQTLLVIDDDQSFRDLLRERLSQNYSVVESGDPEQALGLALQCKPAAILLDLMMPRFSGFELCENLRSCSYTSQIPIFVITGQSAGNYKQLCEKLGAREFFEKPLDYMMLEQALAFEIAQSRPERRRDVRVRLRLSMKLRGVDSTGNTIEAVAETEDLSAGGFLCNGSTELNVGSDFEVFLSGTQDRFVGVARLVRVGNVGAVWHQYGFQFLETTNHWILHR